MRIIYYTSPAFLDPALHLLKEISQRAEVHLLLEVPREFRQTSLFDISGHSIQSGFVPAAPFIEKIFPPGVHDYWKNIASFNFVTYRHRQTIHPLTWRISQKTINFIHHMKPDVLHLDDISLRLAIALPFLKNVSTVLSLHDPEFHSGEHNWRIGIARQLIIPHMSRLILHNHAFRNSFCLRYRLPEQRVKVIPLGVYKVFCEWEASSDVPTDDQTLLFFGRLSPYKGLEVLYAAASQVAQKVPNMHLIVAGQPIRGYQLPPTPLLPNQGRITVINRYISNPELAHLFRQSMAVVCPYTDATQSGVALTAYAFDKPVIATSVGGLPEYVKHRETGLLVDPKNPEALANALISLLTDQALRNRLKAGVKKVKEEFSWPKLAEQIFQVYREVQTPSKS